jgi:hypothetical protein
LPGAFDEFAQLPNPIRISAVKNSGALPIEVITRYRELTLL